MLRDRLPAILVLVAAVLAFGTVAATLDSGQLPTGEANRTPAVDPPEGSGPSLAGPNQSMVVFNGTGFDVWIPPTSLVVGVVALLLGVGLVFLSVRTGSYESLEDADRSGDDDADLDRVSEAAGDAADRIESDADVSNEVYRAWREMVQHLHVPDPDATTPEEFEAAAVSAGMDAAAVAELTDLFRDVRYGELDPAEREERAVATLRRIEATAADPDHGGEGR